MKNSAALKKGPEVLKLPWEYCECGCKGHVVTVGPATLWLHNDLKGHFYLYEGHGPPRSAKLGTFTSFGDADKFAVEYFTPQYEHMKGAVEKLRPVFEK